MYFITTKRMLEVCFSAHPNIQYRTKILFSRRRIILRMVRFFVYPWSGAELNPAPVSFFESGRWPYS